MFAVLSLAHEHVLGGSEFKQSRVMASWADDHEGHDPRQPNIIEGAVNSSLLAEYQDALEKHIVLEYTLKEEL